MDLLHRSVGARLREELEALPPLEGDEPREAPRAPVVSIADLMAEPAEETRYVVEGLLPSSGTSLLAGKPKVGKSTLARTVALAVARGEPVLGRATAQCPVLYLVMEEKRSEVARWFRDAGATDEPIWVFVGSQVEDPPAFFARHARKRGVGLAIIDPLHALLKSGDINDYVRVNEAIQPLQEIARGGLHLMFVHHLGKGERTGGDRVLGSTALFGAVDALITMTRQEGAFVVESIQRYGTDLEPTRVQRQEGTGLLLPAGPAESARDEALQAAILDYLSEGERTEEEIRAAVVGDTGAVGRSLRQLLRTAGPERTLIRTGTGKRGDPFRYSRRSVPPLLDVPGEDAA